MAVLTRREYLPRVVDQEAFYYGILSGLSLEHLTNKFVFLSINGKKAILLIKPELRLTQTKFRP